MEIETNALVPLDVPRDIPVKRGAATLVYKTRRITEKDWLGYYQAIVHQTLQIDSRREEVFDTDTALLELVDKVTDGVNGYGDLSSRPDWKSALPVQQRMAIGMILRSVGPDEDKADAADLADLAEVRLTCAWPVDGKLKLFSGLIHRFRHPSIEVLKRFNFEASRTKVRGNSKSGVSIHPSRQAIAMKIYDELIDSVEGYSVNGDPLAGVEAIKREMDGAHKAAAALQLFTGDSEIEIE